MREATEGRSSIAISGDCSPPAITVLSRAKTGDSTADKKLPFLFEKTERKVNFAVQTFCRCNAWLNKFSSNGSIST